MSNARLEPSTSLLTQTSEILTELWAQVLCLSEATASLRAVNDEWNYRFPGTRDIQAEAQDRMKSSNDNMALFDQHFHAAACESNKVVTQSSQGNSNFLFYIRSGWCSPTAQVLLPPRIEIYVISAIDAMSVSLIE